jgi:hypothetical protein
MTILAKFRINPRTAILVSLVLTSFVLLLYGIVGVSIPAKKLVRINALRHVQISAVNVTSFN